MPPVVTIHRSVLNPPDLAPRHEVQALSALSLLPMLAKVDRLGPRRPPALISAFMAWPRDRFVTDSFGLNPYGPEWAQAGVVRDHAATIAMGSRPTDRRMAGAHAEVDEEIANATALLHTILGGKYTLLTMAQLSGTGYEGLHYDRESSWSRGFNIIVGDTTIDRVAFWNSRIGVDDYQRRNIIAVHVNRSHLDNAEFVATLARFISLWNTSRSQSGGSFATLRSSSVSSEELQPVASALGKLSVHASVETFTSVIDCTPRVLKRAHIRPRHDQRFTDSRVPFVPARPPHLGAGGSVSTWLNGGGWTSHIRVQREGRGGRRQAVHRVPLPRRWQAAQSVAGSAIAKPALDGALRLVVRGDQKPEVLSFTDDDGAFIATMFRPREYLWTSDVRGSRLPQPEAVRTQISSAGRHLLGFLNRLRGLEAAYNVLGDQFWKLVLHDMALPQEAYDDQKRASLAARLAKPIERHGLKTLSSDEDLEALADIVSRIVPNLKVPDDEQSFEWFLSMYRRTDEFKELGQDAGTTPEDTERQVVQKVEAELRERCSEGVLIQGYGWTCRRCLHRNWVSIDNVSGTVACIVCAGEERALAHFSWSFRLDEYVSAGIRERGLRGLVWALGSLNWQARDSFMFSPPLDLYRNEKHLTDADIACIIDGKFVVGEVKESGYNINKALTDKLILCGRIVRPDVLILACLDAKALPKVKKQVDRIYRYHGGRCT
jgi:hypothetical protein